MARPMKVFAALDAEGVTTVRVLVRHDMETGLRKSKKDRSLIPAHFIQNIDVKHGDKTVLSAQWGAAVSKNPSLFCYFKGGVVGGEVTVSWYDNKGESGSKSSLITQAD